MIPKRFDHISKTDIDVFLANSVPEGRTIEYKRDLPANSDDAKREFLADVSSFANGAGGDILYGVTAQDGQPTSMQGLLSMNPDAETLRLDSIVRSGIEPRIPLIQIKAVEGFKDGPILLLRVPKSWASPHMVTYKNLSRFFSRTNAGKSQMDVQEIRSAFLGSEELPERVRRFRDDRLARILAGETPVPVKAAAKLAVHLLPLGSFTTARQFDLALLRERQVDFRPLSAGGWSHRFNVDGLLTFAGPEGEDHLSRSYCQVFRSGHIEAVWADLARTRDGYSFLSSVAYEKCTIDAVRSYLVAMKTLDIQCPIVITVSIMDAAGVRMDPDTAARWDEYSPIDRNMLLLPDVLVEDYQSEVATLLRPVFDAVWNATGFERSMNYDTNGNWRPWR